MRLLEPETTRLQTLRESAKRQDGRERLLDSTPDVQHGRNQVREPGGREVGQNLGCFQGIFNIFQVGF